MTLLILITTFIASTLICAATAEGGGRLRYRSAVGIDLRFHPSVAGGVAQLIADIMSTVHSRLLVARKDGTARLDATLVCLHPENLSIPLLLDDNTRSVMRSEGLTILYPLHGRPEEFCGQRLVRRFDLHDHMINMEMDQSDNEGVLAVSVLDEVLAEHPRWRAPSSGAPYLPLLMQVTVFLGKHLASTLTPSRAGPASDKEVDLDDALFAWRYAPAAGSNLNDSTCAFHYPMDGITIYPNAIADDLVAARLKLLSYIDPDLLRLDAMTSYLFTLQSAVFKLNFTYELTEDNQEDMSWVVAPAGFLQAVFDVKTQSSPSPTTPYLPVDFELKVERMTVRKSGEEKRIVCQSKIQCDWSTLSYLDTASASSLTSIHHHSRLSSVAASHPRDGLLTNLPRTSFPILLKSLGFGRDDVTVEIGSWKGIFSRQLLDRLDSGGPHVMVDPWRHSEDYSDSVNAQQHEQDERYEVALRRMRPHGSRVTILRTTSEEAAVLFGANSVSFVYLDGDHCYAAVMRDLRAWWRQVRDGGVMAGHDYNMAGVEMAVKEFSERVGRRVYFTNEMDLNEDNVSISTYKSWYIIK